MFADCGLTASLQTGVDGTAGRSRAAIHAPRRTRTTRTLAAFEHQKKRNLSLTTDQLNQARAEAWHQVGNPLLTAEDAGAWLRETGVCLFLPRTQPFATAAPSFVEAVLGASEATPSPEAIEAATRLLDRLCAAGDAVPLNLLGTPGEQPDFLATVETLPFLFALIGDKEWKRGPRGKSSPLVIEVWKLLDREGPLTTIEVKEKMGRQLTEAAALRALTDLWSHLRVEPVLNAGSPASWQLLERGRQKQMQAGSTMSQAVALSALVSLYLQSSVAASGDEVELFLSPLASRSKVRDVVKGLTATRQLGTLNLGPVEMYHVEGSLPEFAEIARAEGAVVAPSSLEPVREEPEEGMGEGRRRFVASRLTGEAAGKPRTESKPRQRTAGFERPAADGRKRATADRRPFAPSPGTTGDKRATGEKRTPGGERATGGERRPGDKRTTGGKRATGGERRPYGTRPAGPGGSFNPREPWREDRRPAESGGDRGQAPGERKSFAPREGAGSERRSFASSSDARGERKSSAPRGGDGHFKPRAGARPSGERKPFTPREGGEPRPFAPRGGDQPFKPRSGAKPFGERKSWGDRKPFTPPGSERKSFGARAGGPFKPRDGGERKPFTPRPGDRPFKSRSDAGSDRKPFGERKSFTPRDDAGRKPYPPRVGGEGKPFAPRTGDRPFTPRSDARPNAKPSGGRKSFSDRKPFGDRKPFTPREGGGSERRPFASRTGEGPSKPRLDVRPDAKPYSERKRFGDRKPFPPREGADGGRKPFPPREGADAGRKPFPPPEGARPLSRPSSGAGRPAGRTAGTGARKPSGVRKPTSAARARTSPLTSTGKPRSGVRPPTGRPGPRATRPGGAGARPGFKRAGRPGGKGRSK
jgi:hypothetical protein